MKRTALFIVILILTSCAQIDKSSCEALNQSLETIIPAHQGYIQSDTALSETQKAVMKESCAETLKLSRILAGK